MTTMMKTMRILRRRVMMVVLSRNMTREQKAAIVIQKEMRASHLGKTARTIRMLKEAAAVVTTHHHRSERQLWVVVTVVRKV
jgi:mannose-6-phosphate isomerase-like protein (cupin superfamily)